MDDHRFDDLSRTLAGATSRRGILKLLVGGAIATFASAVSRTAGAQCDLDTCLQAASQRFAEQNRVCATQYKCRGNLRDGCHAAKLGCFTSAQLIFNSDREACHEDPCQCEHAFQLHCDGTCINPNVDPSNCGSCGNVCTGGKVCEAGTCVCSSGQADCGGVCTDLGTELNCGGCGIQCNGCQRCTGGPWAFCEEIYCDDPSQCCDSALGRCVSATEVCAPGQVLDATCSCVCDVSCPEGQVADPTNGCACACVPVTCPGAQVQNPTTCQCECPVSCPEGQSPNPDTCECEGCPVGQEACGDTCVDTLTDLANCGACGIVCAPGETCENGACGCGGQSCSGQCCEGTCVDTQTDPANCGGCGNLCAEGETCSAGTCEATCPISCRTVDGQVACCPSISGATDMYCSNYTGSCCYFDANNQLRCTCPIGSISCYGMCRSDGVCG